MRSSAAALSRLPVGRPPDDAVFISSRVFAVADGADRGIGSGQHALKEVTGRLGPRPYPHPRQLRDAFRRAHVALWFQDDRRLRLRSTVTVAVLGGNVLAIAHVGDCRAYLVTKTDVLQLTREQVGHGSAGDRGIGCDDTVTQLGHHLRPPDPEIRRVRILDGDRVVLATDGLWRNLSPGVLQSTRVLSPPDACYDLVARAPVGSEEASIVVVDFAENGVNHRAGAHVGS